MGTDDFYDETASMECTVSLPRVKATEHKIQILKENLNQFSGIRGVLVPLPACRKIFAVTLASNCYLQRISFYETIVVQIPDR